MCSRIRKRPFSKGGVVPLARHTVPLQRFVFQTHTHTHGENIFLFPRPRSNLVTTHHFKPLLGLASKLPERRNLPDCLPFLIYQNFTTDVQCNPTASIFAETTVHPEFTKPAYTFLSNIVWKRSTVPTDFLNMNTLRGLVRLLSGANTSNHGMYPLGRLFSDYPRVNKVFECN